MFINSFNWKPKFDAPEKAPDPVPEQSLPVGDDKLGLILTPSDLDFVRDAKDDWRHQDALLHQRVTSLLVSEAFLFTAYGALVVAYPQSKTAAVAGLIELLPWIGLALSFAFGVGLLGAILALFKIVQKFRNRFNEGAARNAIFPRKDSAGFVCERYLYVGHLTSFLGALCPLLIFVVVAFLWGLLLLTFKLPTQ